MDTVFDVWIQGNQFESMLERFFVEPIPAETKSAARGCFVADVVFGLSGRAVRNPEWVWLWTFSRHTFSGLHCLCRWYSITFYKCDRFDLSVQYGEKHAIKFNASKTKCVKFSQKKEQRPAPIFLARVALEWADEFVYLGHVIHSDLSISKDMTRVKHSFNQQLNLLMSRFGRITPSLRGHLFKTFCTSLYGIQLWGNELKKENTTRWAYYG